MNFGSALKVILADEKEMKSMGKLELSNKMHESDK